MSKALKALKTISENEETRELAEMRERARINYSSSIAGAYSQGEEKGKAEGKLEGKEEGKAQAITENIKRMSKKGLSPENISDLLEIDLNKVLKILNEHSSLQD